MQKKLILFLLLAVSCLFSVTFSYSQIEINNLIEGKITEYLERVEKENSTKTDFEICSIKKDKLQDLYSKVNKIHYKFKNKKEIYTILSTIKKMSLDKKGEINCYKNNKINNNIGEGDFWLENRINVDSYKYYNYDYSGAKKISYKLSDYSEASDMIGNFYKVSGHRFLFKEYNFFSGISESEKTIYANTAKKQNPGSMLFYYKETDGYRIIMVKRNNINYVGEYNMDYNSIEDVMKHNIKKGKITGVNYISNVLASNGDDIYKSAIFEEDGKLFYFINYGQVTYVNIPTTISEKEQFLYSVYYGQGGKFAYKRDNKFYVVSGELEAYPIGYKYYYDNIDLEKLNVLLENSFYWTAKSGYKYNLEDMYELIDFSKKFNQKKLSELYEYMKTDMEYNITIKEFLQDYEMEDAQIQSYVNTHKDIMKVFNVFQTLNNQEGVCETFSEILSIVALFNGLDSDVVVGVAKNGGYGHQVSKIEGLYYDLTFDLGYQKNKFFAMTKNLLDEYFEIRY